MLLYHCKKKQNNDSLVKSDADQASDGFDESECQSEVGTLKKPAVIGNEESRERQNNYYILK